jgi:ubiquinone biosynthesis protein
MERFARYFLDDRTIYIPKVFREVTTGRVLTMEYIDGIKISDIGALEIAGLNRKKIIERGADVFLRQVFDHGFFHADPHPGNIFVLPNNVICLLDFGVVGSIDRNTREDFVDLVGSVVDENESKVARMLLKLTTWENQPDMRILEKEVLNIMGQHLYKPLKDIEIGKVLQQMFVLASTHRLRIPPDIFFMMKAFATVEGVALILDPDFDMISRTAPFIERIKLARYSPDRIAGDIIGLASELLQFLKQFPKDVLEISRLIKQHKFSVQMEHRGFEIMLSKHDQISNRISFSIIIAALIIGSALIVISQIPPLLYGISLIGIIVFFAAVIMGTWLLIAILKKGRL